MTAGRFDTVAGTVGETDTGRSFRSTASTEPAEVRTWERRAPARLVTHRTGPVPGVPGGAKRRILRTANYFGSRPTAIRFSKTSGAARRTTYPNQPRLSTTFFRSDNLFKEHPAETKLLSQKGLAFYHKQFDVVKIKITGN